MRLEEKSCPRLLPGQVFAAGFAIDSMPCPRVLPTATVKGETSECNSNYNRDRCVDAYCALRQALCWRIRADDRRPDIAWMGHIKLPWVNQRVNAETDKGCGKQKAMHKSLSNGVENE
jgi:hypothetical protein